MLNISFKLTSETVVNMYGETLYRIEAIRDIPSRYVKKGDKGGFISTIEVSGNAQVSGNAWVSGDARVSGNAWVYGDAQVYGNAWVYGDAQVSGNARVSGDAQVSGNAWVSGDAHIDALDAILVLVIAASYSVTITRKVIFAGCQTIKRTKVKNMTVEEFKSIGGKPEYFKAYRQMVLGAMKIVKPKAVGK